MAGGWCLLTELCRGEDVVVNDDETEDNYLVEEKGQEGSDVAIETDPAIIVMRKIFLDRTENCAYPLPCCTTVSGLVAFFIRSSKSPPGKVEEALRDRIDPSRKHKLARPQDEDETVELCYQYEYCRQRCMRGRHCPWRHVRKLPYWMRDQPQDGEKEDEEVLCPDAAGDAAVDAAGDAAAEGVTEGDAVGGRPRGVCHRMVHKKKCVVEGCAFDHDKERVLAERKKWQDMARQGRRSRITFRNSFGLVYVKARRLSCIGDFSSASLLD